MKRVSAIGLFGVILLLQSCASNHTVSNRMIQKRKYNKGFHLSKRGKLHSKSDKPQSDDYDFNNSSQKNQRTIEAQLLPKKSKLLDRQQQVPGLHSLEATVVESQNQLPTITKRFEDNKCDIIMLKNGEEISAKVTEIGTSEIKYKQCDNQDGPTYTLQKSDIFKIKYVNGTSELISAVESTPTARTPMSPASAEQKSKTIRGLSIASIVLSVAGTVLTLFFWFGPIFTSIAVILALTALTLLLIQPANERNPSVARLTYIATGASILLPIIGLIIVLILL